MSLTSSLRGTTRDTINFSKCVSWAARPSNVDGIGRRTNKTHTLQHWRGARVNIQNHELPQLILSRVDRPRLLNPDAVPLPLLFLSLADHP